MEIADHLVHLMVELQLEGRDDVTEVAKLLGGLALDAHRHHPAAAAPLVQRELQADRKVEEARVGRKEAPPGNGRLDASDYSVVEGVLLREAVRRQRKSDRRVVEKGRHPASLPRHVERPPDERLGAARVEAYQVVGVAHPVPLHHVEHQVGQLVGGVLAVGVGAADGRGLYDQEAAVVLGDALGQQEEMLAGLRTEGEQQVERFFAGQPAFSQIPFVVGIQVLVHAAEGDRGVKAFEIDRRMSQPQRLKRLPERLGGLPGHLAAGARDLLELDASIVAAARRGHAIGLIRDPVGPCLQRLAGYDAGVKQPRPVPDSFDPPASAALIER